MASNAPTGEAARAPSDGSHGGHGGLCHAPLAGASPEGEAALKQLLSEYEAPDVLKTLSVRCQGGARMAVRVVFPSWKDGQRRAFPKRQSSASGGPSSYSSFECRLVDVRGDSCVFRVFVDGDPLSRQVQERGKELQERYCDGSAWIVSKMSGLAALKSARTSGCSVQFVLTWSSVSKVAPATFTALMQQSPLERALPRAPLPGAGLSDLEVLREQRLVDLCLRLKEVSAVRQRGGFAVADATCVDERGCRVVLGMWREHAEFVAQHVGRVVYAYDLLVEPGTGEEQASALRKLSTVPGSRLYAPKDWELTKAAVQLLEADAPTSSLRDLVPVFQGRGAYNYDADSAIETTAAALAACLPNSNTARLDLPEHELYEVSGALLLPDRLGPDADPRTKDRARLFVAAQLVDLSGACPVRITEAPALQLANVETAEEFEEQLKDGTLQLSRARVRVRREARDSTVFLTVGAAAPTLVAATPAELPILNGSGAFPARVADVAAGKFGRLTVKLDLPGEGAGTRLVPVSYAVVAVRGTCTAQSQLREGNSVARSLRVVDALAGRELPRSVDLVALVPLALTGAFSVNRGEVALAVVSEAVEDGEGLVCELVVTHVWKLPTGEERERMLASFQQEVQAAYALAARTVGMSRKRPCQASTAEEAGALLVPAGARRCGGLSR